MHITVRRLRILLVNEVIDMQSQRSFCTKSTEFVSDI